VPLTHREHTKVVTFVTGHDAEGIDWSKVGGTETLVIFMGITAFDEIARALIANGRSPETPAMAVRWGTRPDQLTLAGTLATLPGLIHQHDLKPPATIVIGEVVALRDKLNWFEHLPLFGQRIVVTRARGQAEALSSRLHALGAEVIELPTIEIQPALDYDPLDQAIAQLGSYDWLVFTSANGVRFFLERLDRSAVDLRALRARICAIGPATRAALEALHLKVDLMGKDFVAEGMLAAFAAFNLTGQRILLPRAAVARDLVPVELARRGATVDVVEAYRTVVPDSARAAAAEIFSAPRKPDWITFTSSSTVRNLAAVAGADALAGVKTASIGPVTSATARECGIEVTVEASVFTVDGLVDAILKAVSLQVQP
jgi:uroporphyrinogen III methyltransferase/synthase